MLERIQAMPGASSRYLLFFWSAPADCRARSVPQNVTDFKQP